MSVHYIHALSDNALKVIFSLKIYLHSCTVYPGPARETRSPGGRQFLVADSSRSFFAFEANFGTLKVTLTPKSK